jgi:hypothetical protein
MTSITEYKLLDMNDTLVDAKALYPQATQDDKSYPGLRRQVLEGQPPSGSILVKTGGNAFQAIDTEAAQQKGIICVVVPPGSGPGDTIFVQCPYSDRLVSAVIPDGSVSGQVILVKTPPMDSYSTSKPIVDENGIPVATTTEYDDLKLAAEEELERRHFGGDKDEENPRNYDDDEVFEMVPPRT